VPNDAGGRLFRSAVNARLRTLYRSPAAEGVLAKRSVTTGGRREQHVVTTLGRRVFAALKSAARFR
jgi:hypothetical protein